MIAPPEISILDSPRLTRLELAARLSVAPESIDRYVRAGVLKNGERIKLPRVRCGGRSWFLIRDVEEWLRATSDNMPAPPPTEKPVSDAEQHDNAMRELEALGV